MKQRVKDMEAEAAKLRDMQAEVEQQLAPEEGMAVLDRYHITIEPNWSAPFYQIKKPLILVQFTLEM